ncbi:MAG: HNH endonuclease [Alphaproteobacteria bacterium]|nr:HNH endonuclease [Alphaproteobacteria bacterium]
MASNGVNLDALIPREDFATTSAPFKGTPLSTISLGLLGDDFFVQGLRKPDFQRETANWTPLKIVELIAAFLDGDLIPAVILWRSGQFVFVIDGAHRLSAMLAWIYDDYGDKSRSIAFFQNQVPEEQQKLAEQTRRLVAHQIGTYASYRDAHRSIEFASDKIKERVGMMNSNAFIAQWVTAVDAAGAENSFFKINQLPTPVDPVEKRILRARKAAVAIATRAINRGGAGHKYWGEFPMATQAEIEEVGKEIYDALYLPPMGGMPIKSSDVPVGGRGYSSLPFVFDLVNLVNGVGSKDKLAEDTDGSATLGYMRVVLDRITRVTTTHAGSLGLHPLAYFYTRGGTFQPIAFLAVLQVVKKMAERGQLDRFTAVRRKFEEFLMAHKEAFTLIVKRQGSGHRSRPGLEAFLEMTLAGLWAGKTDAEIIESLSADPRFSFFATQAPIREGSNTDKAFSSNAKTAAFVAELSQNGVRCGICGALLHRNSMQTDHIVRKADGGGAHAANAQVAHPYCNSTFKEGLRLR